VSNDFWINFSIIVKKIVLKGTITIVREKCKTLILILRSPERRYYGLGGHIKPEDDINRIIDELGDDLVRSVTEGVNDIRDEVKKARPREDDPNYQLKINIYKDLLEYVKNLIKELTNVFDESLTNYRVRVEQLWDDMQNTSDWEQINVYIKQFENESENLFGDAVQTCLDPYLITIETKLNCI
jgi:hypothetical protein